MNAPRKNTKNSLDGIAKGQVMQKALEIAREEMMRETLDEARNGTDFFETNVNAVRDLVRRVFEAAYAEGLHAGYRQGRSDACREARGDDAPTSPRNPELPTT
ncbi:MAG: hypothetical protein DYG92_10940 [Leptolyngbya sp. PLA1]|nr:hypothetical protein [Leptolyngbya sp. PLA1]